MKKRNAKRMRRLARRTMRPWMPEREPPRKTRVVWMISFLPFVLVRRSALEGPSKIVPREENVPRLTSRLQRWFNFNIFYVPWITWTLRRLSSSLHMSTNIFSVHTQLEHRTIFASLCILRNRLVHTKHVGTGHADTTKQYCRHD